MATPPPPPPPEPAPTPPPPEVVLPDEGCGLIGVSGIKLSWAVAVDDETATTVVPAVPTSVSLGDVAGVRMPRLSYLLLLPLPEAAAFGELAVLLALLLLLDDDEEDEDEEDDDEEEEDDRLEDAI